MLDPTIAAAAAERLGVTDPTPTLETLGVIADHLHRRVGYDTSPKVIWASGRRHTDPPGVDSDEYWDTHLTHGASGSCFATALALDALLAHLGYSAALWGWDLAGRHPGPGVHHATNVIDLDGTLWLLEASSRVAEPLRIPGNGEAVTTDTTTLVRHQHQLRIHTPRAAADGTKLYELVAENMSRDQVIASYRDAVRSHPDQQHNLVWARTRDTGITESIGRNTYLQRDGHTVLVDTPVDTDDIVGILTTAGLSTTWTEQLAEALS